MDFVTDVESDYIEEIIGASFLVLQAKIRRVTSAALKLQKTMLDLHKIDVQEFADVKRIHGLGGRYKRKQASLIQLVWDVGNYYKHRDEWPFEVWQNKSTGKKDRNGLSRRACRSVQRVGIVQFSTGNMRTAYEFFDIDPYSNCVKLAEEVQAWAGEVYKTAQKRLQAEVAASPKIVAPSYKRPSKK